MSVSLIKEGIVALRESLEGSTGFRSTDQFNRTIGAHVVRGRDARAKTLVKQRVGTPHYNPNPPEATKGDSNIMPQVGNSYANDTPNEGSSMIGKGVNVLRNIFKGGN